MTKKIPTYNILVAFNREVFSGLKKAVKQGSFSSYLGAHKDYVLFDNTADNFIRLAHAYSFQEKRGSETDNFTITLEILDPGRIFEEKYLANSLSQLLANNGGNIATIDDTENEIKRLQNILDHSDSSDPDFWKNMGAATSVDGTLENDLYRMNSVIEHHKKQSKVVVDSSESTADFIARKLDVFGTTNLQEPVKANLQPGTYEKFLNEFEKKRVEYLQNIRQQLDSIQLHAPAMLHVSYGCGDDLDNWAGPFMCYLSGAKISFQSDTGFRTITLLLTVNTQFPGLTPIDVGAFEFGKNLQIYGQAPLITTIEQAPVTFGGLFTYAGAEIPLSAEQYEKRKKSNRISQLNATGKAPGAEGVYDYHTAICDCIKDYIVKCTANKANVIVFFPDLNQLLRPLITSYNDSYLFNLDAYGGHPIYITDPSGKEITISRKNLFVVPEIMKELGFDVTSEITSGDKIVTYGYDTLIAPNGTPDANAKLVERISEAYKTSQNINISLIKKPGSSFMDALKRVTSGMSILKVVQPVFLVENNSDFIKELKGFCDEHAKKENARRAQIENTAEIRQKIRLGEPGYSGEREEILNIDPSKPLIIYGDKTMIDRFFFGKIKLEKIGLFKFGFGSDENGLQFSEKNKSAGTPTSYFNYNYLVAGRDRKFISDDYFRIADKYFQTNKKDNCFNSYTLPKSQFAFDPDDEKKIQQSNIPVFKFGVQDPNILSIDMDIDQYYFNILNSVLYQTASLHKGSRGTITKTDSGFNALLELNKDKVSEILNAFTIVKPDGTKGLSQSGVKAAKELSLFSEVSEKDIESLFVGLMALSGEKTIIQNLEWWQKKNPAVHFTKLISQLSQIAYRGTITTLPFFHLSNNVGAINPALLFIRESSILGINKSRAVSDVLNGLWVIYGYEHSISRGEAQSSFHITKDPRIQLPNTLMPVKKEESINTIKVSDKPYEETLLSVTVGVGGMTEDITRSQALRDQQEQAAITSVTVARPE